MDKSSFRRMSRNPQRTENRSVDAKRQLLIAGAHARILVSSSEAAGLYTICQIEIAGGQAIPEHSHQYEDVFLYVLGGEFEFTINAQQQAARAGASLFVTRQTPYSLRCVAGEPGRILVFAQPGGLDLLLREAAQTAGGRTGLSPSETEALAEKHGIALALRNPPGSLE